MIPRPGDTVAIAAARWALVGAVYVNDQEQAERARRHLRALLAERAARRRRYRPKSRRHA